MSACATDRPPLPCARPASMLAAHEQPVRVAEPAAHRPQRRGAGALARAVDPRRDRAAAGRGRRGRLGAAARRPGAGPRGARARDGRCAAGRVGAGRHRLRHGAPPGDRVGEDHRQGARGADRGRPARRRRRSARDAGRHRGAGVARALSRAARTGARASRGIAHATRERRARARAATGHGCAQAREPVGARYGAHARRHLACAAREQ